MTEAIDGLAEAWDAAPATVGTNRFQTRSTVCQRAVAGNGMVSGRCNTADKSTPIWAVYLPLFRSRRNSHLRTRAMPATLHLHELERQRADGDAGR
jgi:hypothetical protein